MTPEDKEELKSIIADAVASIVDARVQAFQHGYGVANKKHKSKIAKLEARIAELESGVGQQIVDHVTSSTSSVAESLQTTAPVTGSHSR